VDEPTSELHVARTTVAAVASLLVARAVALPEPYWATISTLVAMQSSLRASWEVSRKRFTGTLLGAAVGGALASLLHPGVLLFAAAVLGMGLLCALVRLDRVAYRYIGITLAIVILVPHERPAWITAAHRFAEVSIGIAVALALTALWPERRSTA
jgi:uncharacterized membrane protein YccC